MSEFKVHTKQTAPEKSAKLLEQAQSALGFVPNLLGVFAESPATLKAYLTLGQSFDESSFTPIERQIVILTVSRFNECQYCVAAHSIIAGATKVPNQAIRAIRSDEPIEDTRLEALRRFTTAVVDKRGSVSEEDVKSFEAAGFKVSGARGDPGDCFQNPEQLRQPHRRDAA